MASADVITLTLPAQEESLGAVHDLISRLWRTDPGVGEADRVRLETAVVEIVGNIVAHAGTPPGQPVVTFTLTLAADTAMVAADIEDDGLPADVDTSPDMPQWGAESGRGLALTRAMTDEFSLTRRGDRNVWRVALRRS